MAAHLYAHVGSMSNSRKYASPVLLSAYGESGCIIPYSA